MSIKLKFKGAEFDEGTFLTYSHIDGSHAFNVWNDAQPLGDYIVRAVNAYAQLIDALKAISGNHDRCCDEEWCSCPSCIATKALADAEEQNG